MKEPGAPKFKLSYQLELVRERKGKTIYCDRNYFTAKVRSAFPSVTFEKEKVSNLQGLTKFSLRNRRSNGTIESATAPVGLGKSKEGLSRLRKIHKTPQIRTFFLRTCKPKICHLQTPLNKNLLTLKFQTDSYFLKCIEIVHFGKQDQLTFRVLYKRPFRKISITLG